MATIPNGDGITVPKMILALLVPLGFSIMGWFLTQLYTISDQLDKQVQDIDRTQEAIKTRQQVIITSMDQEQKQCAEYRKGIEEKIEDIKHEIDKKADKSDATDRFRGADWAQEQRVLSKQQEINDQTHDSLWTEIHSVEEQVRELHDWLFKR